MEIDWYLIVESLAVGLLAGGFYWLLRRGWGGD